MILEIAAGAIGGISLFTLICCLIPNGKPQKSEIEKKRESLELARLDTELTRTNLEHQKLSKNYNINERHFLNDKYFGWEEVERRDVARFENDLERSNKLFDAQLNKSFGFSPAFNQKWGDFDVGSELQRLLLPQQTMQNYKPNPLEVQQLRHQHDMEKITHKHNLENNYENNLDKGDFNYEKIDTRNINQNQQNG